MQSNRYHIPCWHLVLFFLLSINSAPAQDSISTQKKFPFIRYDLNRLEFPGDTNAFNKFLDKCAVLRDSQNVQVNVVHIGGSHVQADMWTGRIRENFNRFFEQKESARGIIFPYKAVKTNGSLQFDITFGKPWEGSRNVKLIQPAEMGLMGWSARTTDPHQYLDITLKGDTISNFCFDRLHIFHGMGVNSFPFTILADDSVYVPQYSDECYCSEVKIGHTTNRFVINLNQTDSVQNEFALQGIVTSVQKPGFTYHSVGVNGASVPSYLNCLLLAQQLQQLYPDLVIFSIGINDSFDKNFSVASFEANYNELIRRIKTTCPDVAILFITNTDSYKKVKKKYYKNANGKAVREAMFRLAATHNAAVWDLFSIMGGFGSIAKWKQNGMAQPDHIHLNRSGYQYIGDLFFEAIMNQYRIANQNP